MDVRACGVRRESHACGRFATGDPLGAGGKWVTSDDSQPPRGDTDELGGRAAGCGRCGTTL